MKGFTTFQRTAVVVMTALVGCASSLAAARAAGAQEYPLTEADRQAIEAAHRDYRDGWVSNAPETVMNSFDANAMMIPHHGNQPVVGSAAIRQFFWPADSPPSTVTEFTTEIREIFGSGDFAFSSGRFTLAFEYEGTTYANAGNFVEVYRRQPAGDWKIFRRIWNDPVAETR